MRRNPKRDKYEEAGLMRASVLLETPEGNVAKSVYLDGPQEWIRLADTVFEDPEAGYRGKKFTIPKGQTVVFLRLEDPEKNPGG